MATDDAIDVARCERCDDCGAYHRATVPCAQHARTPRMPAWAETARPVVGPLPVSDPPRRFDADTHEWNAARDLERLAEPRWFRHFYGRGVNMEPSVRATGERDLPLDKAATIDRERVKAIHARLEGLRVGVGRMHYAVLVYAFLEHGPGQRMPSASLVQGREASRAEVSEAFLEELGLSFASKALRAKWRRQPVALRHSLPRAHGRGLYQAAVDAWESA